jgi:general stress protein CsbA
LQFPGLQGILILVINRPHFFSKKEGVAMVVKYLSALLLPGFVVILFSRVTYNHFIGLVLTVALIAASVYKGYTDSWLLIFVDAFSLTAGFWYSARMIEKTRKKT